MICHPNITWAREIVKEALGHADFAIKGRIFLIKGDRVTEGDLNTITWDSLMGCYTMSWQGMLLGIETDGHIHS
jgi:hypothetical protein